MPLILLSGALLLMFDYLIIRPPEAALKSTTAEYLKTHYSIPPDATARAWFTLCAVVMTVLMIKSVHIVG